MGSTQVAGGTAVETTPEPKYWQLRTVLVRALDTEFSAGEVLPNERDLSARFGVARATLRQALDQLELEGRLVRRRGIGTLVAAPRMGVPMVEATDNHFGAGRDSWRIVDADYAAAPAAVAAALGVAADEPVHVVRRLRMMRGQAIGAETLYVPDAVVPQPPGSYIKHSLAESSRARSVLRQLQRLEPDGESRAVELGVAEDEAARLLERPPGIPVLVVTARYRAQGRVAVVGVSTYRADTCRLTFGESGMVEVAPVAAPAPAEVRAAS
ncbi:GntR family transcriptional regulator [Streptacidiphilus sp. PB12-B1b]|uniref:GntR family transcriptional regulator n=1 Tax=Streptacidiphilus sp. PB12-B1b TaxID=2705012 RepID=UPI0015FDCD07|nr:GntR family transcriptional regulator [Streptacidiphilus sp. PB12-B1b]QMU76228.1 GntR family transcriptional regulator [Streptacidiphilus sp. PB12-B1b]